MILQEVQSKIDALGELTDKQRRGIVCQLIGHSKIISMCYSYVYCGRCNDQLGDNLGSIYDLEDKVIVGCNCDKCRKNYEKLDWTDTFMVQNPFTEEKVKP